MKKNIFIIVGSLLISLSIYPYFLILQEGRIESATQKRYSIISVKAATNQLVINQNKIDIIEEKKGDLSRLQIKVNDQTIGTTEDAKL